MFGMIVAGKCGKRRGMVEPSLRLGWGEVDPSYRGIVILVAVERRKSPAPVRTGQVRDTATLENNNGWQGLGYQIRLAQACMNAPIPWVTKLLGGP